VRRRTPGLLSASIPTAAGVAPNWPRAGSASEPAAVNSPAAGSSFPDALHAFTKALQRAYVPAVIVGGVAVPLLGRPRSTRDMDAPVDPDESR